MQRTISSRSSARFREARELRSSRGRKKHGKFLVDGSREILRAMQSGLTLETLFVPSNVATSAGEHAADFHSLLQLAERSESVWCLTEPLYEQICYGQRRSDAVAIVSATELSLTDLEPSENPIVVVLDSVEKPGNIGAVFRTADAMGADCIVMSGQSTDPFNPNAIRASAGTVFSVPWVKASYSELWPWLAHQKMTVALARVDARESYWDLPLCSSIALVFGNEATGLGDEWSSQATQAFRIPMQGIADSLNVSVSTAVVLFEASRQRYSATA